MMSTRNVMVGSRSCGGVSRLGEGAKPMWVKAAMDLGEMPGEPTMSSWKIRFAFNP